MIDRIFLFILKNRLRCYKRDAKWYENIGAYNNWYHEQGIPNLEKSINELQEKINKRRNKQ